MKAVQINSYGGVEVLEINGNVPVPSPQKGQVLVENHAASINPIDWKIRAGYLKEMAPLSFPALVCYSLMREDVLVSAMGHEGFK